MERLLVPAAVAALLFGCARPAMFGLQSDQSNEADSAIVEVASEPTVIVREVHHEVPVVYVDTVYLEEEYSSPETVYVEDVYESYVYVPEPVLVPVPVYHDHQRPRWRQREHEPRPPDRRGDEGSRERRDRPTKKQQPRIVVPGPPVQKTVALVMDAIQKSPDKPTPPDQPAAPKLQAPAKGGSVPATQNKTEAPKLVPAPPVDKPASSESKVLQVQVGMRQATRK
jgi:hypothetical protein